MAERHGVGKDTVARLWKARKLRPWPVDTFKLSSAPRFEEELVDPSGSTSTRPSGRWCSASMRRPSAKPWTGPSRRCPLKPGRARTMTHHHKRNGTTDLFAASNVGTGEVLRQTRRSHKGSDVLSFFRWIDLHTPRDLEIHVVLDNLSALRAPEVREWLARPRQACWHLHFTPTGSSWVDLVEGWFAQLTKKRLRTGSFKSVDALTEAIEVWVSHWNDDPKPFV